MTYGDSFGSEFNVRGVLLLIVLGSTLTNASATEGVCDNASNGVALSACIDRALKKAEADLTNAYRGALKADEDVKENVTEAQRAWISYRDKQCRGVVARQWMGGSGQGIAVGTCLIERDKDRTRELQTSVQ